MIIAGYITPNNSIGPYNLQLQTLDLSKCTHLFHMAVYVYSATDPTLRNPWDNAWQANISYAVIAGHAKNVSVSVTLGGGAELYPILRDNSLRAQLITNLVAFTLAPYYADGISIDWEGWEWQADRQQLQDLLIMDLRAALAPGKLISSYCGVYLPNLDRFNVSLVGSSYLDFICLGTYFESYRPTQTILNSWIAMGYPPEKLLAGNLLVAMELLGDGSLGREFCTWADIVTQLHPSDDQNSATGLTTPMVSHLLGDAEDHTPINGTLVWQGVNQWRTNTAYVRDNGIGGMVMFSVNYDVFLNPDNSILQAIYEEANATPTIKRHITITIIGSGTTSVGTQDVNDGEPFTVEAFPNSGWYFSRWEKDGQPYTTEAICLIPVVTTDMSLTAYFSQTAPTTATIIFSTSPSGIGEINPTGSQVYNVGQKVNVTAISSTSGWKFDHWSGAASGTLPTIEHTVTGDATIVAVFTEITTPPPSGGSTMLIAGGLGLIALMALMRKK